MSDRTKEMADLFSAGLTLQEIGTKYGISRERVRQLITRDFGMTREDGGMFVRAKLKKIRKRNSLKERKDARIRRNYLCSLDDFIKATGCESKKESGLPRKYLSQKMSAHKRGIEWLISFPEWMDVWKKSGKLSLRGRGDGYCMARKGDIGPYHKDNVYICTIGQNFSDSYKKISYFDRFRNIRKLIDGEVVEIKRLISEGVSCACIARKFGVSAARIRNIKNNKHYCHI